MEACSLILLLLGIATAGIRLSWADRKWPAAFAAMAWAGLPWLSGDLAARTSAARIRAWVSAPDRPESFALVLLIEAILGGWAAFRLAGETAEGEGRGVLRMAAALAPSPALALGMLGCQVALFHRVAGHGFSTLTAALSGAVAAGLIGAASLARRLRPRPGSRAGLAVPAYAGLFLAGAALSPLAHRPPAPAHGVAVDLPATAAAASVAAALAGVGLAAHQLRSRRKGADAR